MTDKIEALREKAVKASEDQWGNKKAHYTTYGLRNFYEVATPPVVLSLISELDRLRSSNEAMIRLASAWKAHVDAVNAYNARLEVVRAERERGNWSMKVDHEYRVSSDARSAFIRTAQDIADAALSLQEEEAR